MVDSSFSAEHVWIAGSTDSPSSFSPSTTWQERWLGRVTLTLAVVTLFLMALGSATRVMNAGLSCPDWPLCYGEIVPAQQMNLQVFLEWFHRLVASSLGLVVLIVTGLSWFYRQRLAPWIPMAMSWALGLVMVQGLLGGLTVTELLRFDIVTAHLGTGLLFFATLLTIALCLLPVATASSVSRMGSLPWLAGLAALLVYGQSLLGGLVASQWAVHQCLGSQQLCAVMNSHLLGVIPASLATLVVVVSTLVKAIRHPLPPLLPKLALLGGGLLIGQLALGWATFRLHLQVEPLTVAHQAIGAALLGSLVALTVLAWREQRRSFRALAV
ncbi:MAG: COX15/CtaA family protein [Cyanobacteriota bacterium]|nr:COX15/CtaA family protein [Cyanobacteriota bacterium]